MTRLGEQNETGPESPEARVGADPWRRLAGILALVSLWAIVTPYAGEWLGIELNPGRMVEVVDHVVPGVLALALTGYAAWAARVHYVPALAVVLAGFWMTATHVPLIGQAMDSQVPWSWAIWHFTPGILLLIMSAGVAILALREAED